MQVQVNGPPKPQSKQEHKRIQTKSAQEPCYIYPPASNEGLLKFTAALPKKAIKESAVLPAIWHWAERIQVVLRDHGPNNSKNRQARSAPLLLQGPANTAEAEEQLFSIYS